MKRFLSFILAIAIIIVSSCKDGIQKDKGGGIVPPKPPVVAELEKGDVLNLFDLKKGDITASAAAKKIKRGSSSAEITFTEIKIISYDDELGEFKIHLKGTKKGSAPFDKTFIFTDFIHPLKGKTIQSLKDIELDFDEAIEHNYSLDRYIEELNKSIKQTTILKKLSFMLNDSSTIIELGEYDRYIMVASAEKIANQILIKPQVVYLKLHENTTTEIEENILEFSFVSLKTQLTKNYFSDKDVFRYVLNKVDANNIIKENKNEFASSFYAFVKRNGVAPNNIFTETFKSHVEKYHEIYREKDANEHLKLDIGYGIVGPKNEGVKADDYEGSLKIDICIATNEQIINQNNIVVMKTIEKNAGFASIPDDKALEKKTHLFFNLIPKAPLTNETKDAWEKKQFPENTFLLRVDENGVASVNNPFNVTSIPFHICVNSSETNPSTHLGCADFGASKTRNEKVIFIENIQLKKSAGEKTMDVLITLKGANAKILKMTVEPY